MPAFYSTSLRLSSTGSFFGGSTSLFRWKPQPSLPANSGIARSWWCDETVRGTRPCKRVHRIIFLAGLGVTNCESERFKSIVASGRIKTGSIEDVATPVPKIYPS